MNTVNKVQGHDMYQRMNYLYQISKCLADKNLTLSSYYANQMSVVAKKNVLKIHPDIKRQICKKCSCILINNVTTKIHLKKNKKNKSKFIVWTCNTCHTKKRFPATKDYTVWVDRPEAVVEVISY